MIPQCDELETNSVIETMMLERGGIRRSALNCEQCNEDFYSYTLLSFVHIFTSASPKRRYPDVEPEKIN